MKRSGEHLQASAGVEGTYEEGLLGLRMGKPEGHMEGQRDRGLQALMLLKQPSMGSGLARRWMEPGKDDQRAERGGVHAKMKKKNWLPGRN